MEYLCFIVFAALFLNSVNGQAHLVVGCSESEMEIHVPRRGVKELSLGNWDVLTECQATISQEKFIIKLKLLPEPSCGVIRMKNFNSEKVTYYHHILVTSSSGVKQEMKVVCPGSSGSSNRFRRNVLPAGFNEPDYIEITKVVADSAPVPKLSVGVRHNGILIGDTVTVSPGAALTMEVSLDEKSTDVYGILVSYLIVTDNSEKNETILYNGCTQDQYVFENFHTTNGDKLEANFKAFKFPGSSYLLFKGTVDVCLDKCQAVTCSNGEMGYGRKKRDTYNKMDPNKIFEASMMTLIRLEEDIETGEHYNRVPMLRNSKFSHDLEGDYVFFNENSCSCLSRASFLILCLFSVLIRTL